MSERGVAVDLHVKILDEAVVRRAKARGLDALVYAPHYTQYPEIAARARRFSDEDLTVIPARELFAGPFWDRKHVLALDLTAPVADYVTLAGTMAELRRQDAVVLVPHPDFLSVGLAAEDVREYADLIDAVEVYNPKHLPWHNRRARRIAESTDLPRFGSTYAHVRGTVGEVWTRVPGVDASEEGILEALRDGVPRSVERRRGTGHRARCLAEFAHMSYENSLEKAYLFAKGPKATNPYHPAYDGRFDDVGVYPESLRSPA
jgi:predicted metal-dependent phosphoesterase TrpH